MLKAVKIPVLWVTLSLLIFFPMVSNAWDYPDKHDDGRFHHRHGFHDHANPDLTLVSGMDNIDSKVLVDPTPDPGPEVIDQALPETEAIVSLPAVSPDPDGNFIVKVPNRAGGYTPIRLEKFGNGYLGPGGELYYPFPEISQLKAMYRL